MGVFERIRAKRQPGNSAEPEPEPPATAAVASSPTISSTKESKEKSKEVEVNAIGPVDQTASNGEKIPLSSEKEGDTANVEESEEVEDESKYPTGFPLAILTFGLCVCLFVVALDNTIIATAIPRITTVFDALNDVGWFGSSYLLTQLSLQPSFGKVYTYFNVKWTFIIALLIFEVGSILCAAATGSVMFIIGRAVAGVGSAAIFSGGMTIIGYTVPLRKRPIYIACLSSMFGIASVVGPVLGGVLTDKASWRWCFWINLPVGGVGLLTVFIFFKNPERKHSDMSLKEKIDQIDLLGATFLICSIICLLLALQWGGSVYPWHDSKVWGCIIGFVFLVLIFIYLQFRRGDKATIPPRIFLRQRTVLMSSWFSCFLSMGVYTHIFYLPFYFQAVKGTTAEQSGIRTIPFLVSTTIGSVISGGLITAIGVYVPFTWFGAAIFTVGAGLLYTLRVNSSAGIWIGYQVLTGLGAGIGIQIPFIAVQTVLNSKDMPSGNAIAIFFNSLGGALSISIAQNIFTNTLSQKLITEAPDVSPMKIISAGATHVREVTPAGSLNGVLQAYTIAINQAFILPIAVGILAFICSFFLEWKSVKGKSLMGGGGA